MSAGEKSYAAELRRAMSGRKCSRRNGECRTVVGGHIVWPRTLPMLQGKFIARKSLCAELCWMLRGRTDVQWLQEHGCRYWNDDAAAAPKRGFDYAPGQLGPVYGWQWRHFSAAVDADGQPAGPGQVDQIRELLTGLARDPARAV